MSATTTRVRNRALIGAQASSDEPAREQFNEINTSATQALSEVRGLGLLLGVELVRGRGHPAGGTGPQPIQPAREEAEAVLYRCLAHGLSFKITMGNILTLTPPLTLSEAELDRSLDILEEAITTAGRGRAQPSANKT